MAVDVLLFTGYSSYSTNIKNITDNPIYEVRTRTSGTYRIATHLRNKHGLDVEVVDFIHSWSFDELKEIVDSRIGPDTKMAGVGGIFFVHSPIVINIFKYIKKNYPHVITAAGSQDIWSISQIPEIDYYVTGYGELGVDAILQGNPEYVEWQMFEHTPKIKLIDCMTNKKYNAWPFADLSIDYEKRDFIEPYETLSMETSRGCRFQCAYCNFPILGVKSDHTRSQENFETDIKRNYDKWGTTDYIITDDTFNDYIEKIRKYADVVQSVPYELNFTGYIRADLMTRRKGDLEELGRMRFNSHLYGIESSHHPATKAIGKGGNPREIMAGVLEAKEYFKKHTGFYRGEMSFIWGLPGETQETIDWTFDWIDKNWRGEAVAMFPLQIPKEGGLARSNLMTSNIDKYGYRFKQPIEVEPIGNKIDHILNNPNIDEFLKDRIIQGTPDINDVSWQVGGVLWQNDQWDFFDAWLGVQNYLYGNERFWDRGVPIFNQANWLGVGYKKSDMMKTFGELGSMMHPPEEMRIAAINDYKQKKLSWVS